MVASSCGRVEEFLLPKLKGQPTDPWIGEGIGCESHIAIVEGYKYNNKQGIA